MMNKATDTEQKKITVFEVCSTFFVIIFSSFIFFTILGRLTHTSGLDEAFFFLTLMRNLLWVLGPVQADYLLDIKYFHESLYTIIFLSILILVALRRLSAKKIIPLHTAPLRTSIPMIGFVIIALTMIIYTPYHMEFIQRARRAYSGLSPEEKAAKIYGFSYEFAEFCKTNVPGTHRGKLIISLDDITPAKMSLMKRHLVYFLYPAIDFEFDRDRPVEYAVIVSSDNPKGLIPKNFETAAVYNKNALLAVKKK